MIPRYVMCLGERLSQRLASAYRQHVLHACFYLLFHCRLQMFPSPLSMWLNTCPSKWVLGLPLGMGIISACM
jgi:hypothetical protein